jgi:hypothetical protein
VAVTWRRALLAVILLCPAAVCAAATTAAASQSCREIASDQRYEVLVVASVRLTVCDHRAGRYRTVREGGKRLGGTIVVGRGSVRGRVVYWVEAFVGRDRSVERLRGYDLGRHRLVADRVLVRVARPLALTARLIGAAALADGSMGLLTSIGPYDGRLRLERAGQRTRILASGSVREIGVEDGVTLRWVQSNQDSIDRYRFYDAAPLPRANGCPVRSRFSAVLLSTPEVLVSAEPVRYDLMFSASGPWRACLRATGVDPVLGDRREGGADLLTGVAGDWLLIRHSTGSRSGCGSDSVSTYNLRWLTPGRASRPAACPSGLPRTGSPLAITPAGVPAWVVTANGQDTLHTIAADRGLILLDRASAGDITALQAVDESFTWLAATEPKAVPAP